MNQPPYQNQPKKSTPWVAIIAGIAVVVCGCPLGIAIVGGVGLANSKEFKDAIANVEAPAESKPAKKLYTVDDVKGKTEGGVKYVTGTLTNNSGEKKDYVQVEINLKDKSGTVVGSTLANINNLEAGQKWKFKAVVLEESAASFEVKDVVGF